MNLALLGIVSSCLLLKQVLVLEFIGYGPKISNVTPTVNPENTITIFYN